MNLADQLGIGLRGVQNGLAKALSQLQPGGANQQGVGLPVLRGKGIPRIPRLNVVATDTNRPTLPPVGTSPTPGRMPAPHPTRIPTESTLGIGFRNIRRGN